MRERMSAKYCRLWMGETTFDCAVPPRRGRHNREYMGGDEGQPNNKNMDNDIRDDGDDDINEDDLDEDQVDEEPTGLDDDDEFVMPMHICERIGQDMHNARTTVPAVYGRPTRDISKYFWSFKAAEWSSWILLYSIPLLHESMPQRYVNHKKIIVRICTFICARAISKEECNELERLCMDYVIGYEGLYFRGRWSRSKLMKSNLHIITHLANMIRDAGPVVGWWCFPIERFKRMIEGKVRSKVPISVTPL